MINVKDEKKTFRMFLPFVIIIIIIFLVAISFSWQNISNFFSRLGIVPGVGIMAEQREFTYSIPSLQLQVGKVVGYYSFANDTSGNQNITDEATFIVIFPENITDIHIENESHIKTATIQKGHQFYVVFKIINERTKDVTRRYIVQIVDPNGMIVQPINSNRMTISSGYEEENDVSFIAEKTGTYTAQVFVWAGWLSQPESGFPIAYSKTINFNSV